VTRSRLGVASMRAISPRALALVVRGCGERYLGVICCMRWLAAPRREVRYGEPVGCVFRDASPSQVLRGLAAASTFIVPCRGSGWTAPGGGMVRPDVVPVRRRLTRLTARRGKDCQQCTDRNLRTAFCTDWMPAGRRISPTDLPQCRSSTIYHYRSAAQVSDAWISAGRSRFGRCASCS